MVVWHCPCKSRSPPGASSQTLVAKATGVCSFWRVESARCCRHHPPLLGSTRTLVAFASGVCSFGAMATSGAASLSEQTSPSSQRKLGSSDCARKGKHNGCRVMSHARKALDPRFRGDDGEEGMTVRKDSGRRVLAMRLPEALSHSPCALVLSPIMQNAADRRPTEQPSRVCPCRNPTS